MKQDRKKIRDIQKRFLVNFLDFCEQNQIHDRKDVLSLKLREVLDHPLWKLLELDGKYGGRYISEGVHQLETVLGKRVSRTAGRWPKKLVKEKQKMLADMGFDEHSSLKCQLDHVSERKQLGDALMNKMIKATDIEVGLLLNFGKTPEFERKIFENRFK